MAFVNIYHLHFHFYITKNYNKEYILYIQYFIKKLNI